MLKPEYIPVGKIKPNPQNPRVIKDEAFKRLCASLREDRDYFEARPILVNKDMVIFAGNQRYRAAVEIGMKEVPVIVMDNPGLEAKRMLRDNISAGDWDMDILANDFDADFLREVGFSDDELGELAQGEALLDEEKLDEVPDKPETAITKPGDLWLLGDHRLLCGDSTSDAAIARLMDDAKADMIFTDPPYGIAYVGKTKKRLTIQNDAMSDADFSAFLGKAFGAMRKVCDGGAPYYVCHADGKTMLFRQALMDSGFEVKQTVIWAKQSFVLGRQDYQWQHEPILYGWAAGASHKWYGGRAETTVWEINRPTRSEEHPTMKPVELCARAIRNSSRKGDTVLDLFGGSGSTLIACEHTGRKACLCEIDPLYTDVIVKRWEQATGRKAEVQHAS
ncbi:MAG TPA: DNA modification methylase [Elusimicrobiales bacterium]|nr:DNA modification methylase [Elusimicrobiales bacterium]